MALWSSLANKGCWSLRVYQRLAVVLAGPVHTIYSCILKLGQWPEQWRLSGVCSIYKNKDPAVYMNYRPISIIDVLS